LNLFSQRKGFKDVESILKQNYNGMTSELRIRLHNLIIRYLKFIWKHFQHTDWIDSFQYKVWDEFLHLDINELDSWIRDIRFSHFLSTLSRKIKVEMNWYEIYDLLEFIYQEFTKLGYVYSFQELLQTFQSELNKIFEKELTPYRMINGQITPITDEHELKTIEEALANVNTDNFKPVKDHLEKAIKHLSNKTNPDYANSIKESISALESLANLILGTQGKTLTSIHQKLCSQLKCPKVTEKQIKEYYDWASSDEGIRHGKTDKKSKIGLEEAKLFLAQISSLINYLIAKSSKV